MLFGGLLDEERRQGREEGFSKGRVQEREELLGLIAAMSKDGRADEIPRLSQEPEFFCEMKDKYQI